MSNITSSLAGETFVRELTLKQHTAPQETFSIQPFQLRHFVQRRMCLTQWAFNTDIDLQNWSWSVAAIDCCEQAQV